MPAPLTEASDSIVSAVTVDVAQEGTYTTLEEFQESPHYIKFIIDNLWILIAAFLVLLMHLGFDAHVIAPRPESTEGGGQVPQAVTKGKLTKAQTKQLITTRECLRTVIPFVMINNFSKFI